jgi:hypothetical protein
MVAYHPYSLPVYMYVAFGSQGLPAMMPILIPTLAATVVVFALSNISVSPAPRHSRWINHHHDKRTCRKIQRYGCRSSRDAYQN